MMTREEEVLDHVQVSISYLRWKFGEEEPTLPILEALLEAHKQFQHDPGAYMKHPELLPDIIEYLEIAVRVERDKLAGRIH